MKICAKLAWVLAVLCSASIAGNLEIKDITFTTKGAGKAVFSHTLHNRQKDIKNNCKACHNVLFDMKKKIRHSMAEMEQGKSCGACHNGKTAFGLSDCTKCHPVKEVLFKVKDAGDVKFSHNFHLNMYKCGDCHDKLYKTGKNSLVSMAEMEKGKSCGACHDE